MDKMFLRNFSFNQNLTGWCVSQISSTPTQFSAFGALAGGNKPVWGTTVNACDPPELAATNPTSPAEGATGVAVSSDITLTFDEMVTANTGNITIAPASGTAISIAVTNSQVSIGGTNDTVVTINPTSNLMASTEYTVFVPTHAFQDSNSVRT